ncbi:MAG: hypothetical protein IPJ04_03850 [Candidatus Eisenbacteria bacterium]|nr:hypothetical protein [Candidatus Eisenbacteria bacterium]
MLRCPPTHALALAAALWFAAVFTAPASAQDATVHKLPSPAWAVEFGLANASLSSFDGAMISLRQQKSAHAAWRYGLSVSASTSNNDQDRTTSPSAQVSNDELKLSSSNLALSITRLTFPAPDAVVRPWFGAGLELGWSTSNYERNTTYYDQDGAFSGSQGFEDRNHGPSAALMGLFGLEWSASERFVIHAQYGQAIRYRRLQYEYDEHQVYVGASSDYHREGPMNEWSTYGVSARAGVSVFW